jgi:glycine cleavage system H lipoate-binding protein/ABC-type phosphate transport system substrate-binding protein
MKTKIFTISVLLLLAVIVFGNNDEVTPPTSKKTINVFSSSETYDLVESWTSAYANINIEQNFEINLTDNSALKSIITDDNTLGFIVKHPDEAMISDLTWQMVVGRNVVVAVINKENPYTETLNKVGVSAQKISEMLKSGQPKNWNMLLKNQLDAPIRVYLQNKPEVELSVSKFLGIEPSELTIIDSKTSEEFLSAIQNDKYAIGFCLLANVANLEQNDFAADIKLLPIDRNDNGNLDYNENFYGSLENFERAVWIGKYPKSLIQNIYAVSAISPKNENISNFLSWVVTSGQQFNISNGYTDLVYSEMQSNLEKLNPVTPLLAIQKEKSTSSKTWSIIIVSITMFIIFASLFIRDRKKTAKKDIKNKSLGILNEDSIKLPGGLLFDKSHTWVFMEKDGMLKIGIDDFLQHVTGKITGIIMKAPGDKIAKNELIVSLTQEGKKIDIYSSVTGVIKEINEDLVTSPSLINSSPYSKGWIYSVEPTNWSREISFLKIAETYREWIKREFVRLKNFIASINSHSETEGHLVFQEGGEIYDHVLQQMGPKVWEDFQINFIDNSDIN